MGALASPIIGLGSTLLGGLFGKKAQSSAQQRSPEEAAALTGAGGAAGNLLQGGQSLFAGGLPALTNARNYWATLLGGNRAAMAQATAGPRAAITEEAQGAARGIERSGARGAVRDLAKSELSRDTFAKTAGLTTGVQPVAAQQLGSLGGEMTGQGITASGTGGQLYSNLLGEGALNRYYARQQGAQAAGTYGRGIFDILKGGYDWWKGRKGGPAQTPWSDTMPGGVIPHVPV